MGWPTLAYAAEALPRKVEALRLGAADCQVHVRQSSFRGVNMASGAGFARASEVNPIQNGHEICPVRPGAFAPGLSVQASCPFCIGFTLEALQKSAPEAILTPRRLY